MFKKVLIANRGEIAVRIIRACRELGIKTVAVHSDVDRDALHVRIADESVCIGPGAATESYLNIPALISAAEITGVDGIHPGYGFLSENTHFADVCESCGIKFIGPSPVTIKQMGDKLEARRLVSKYGVPVLPGTDGPVSADDPKLLAIAKKIGYPIMVKARAGGGGKGMRIVHDPAALKAAVHAAQTEAKASFKDAGVYLEKFLESPRHIEVQVAGDQFGNVVSYPERDCTIQRRHQKLVEESPSPMVNDKLRKKMGKAARRATRAAKYVTVGTVEFLYDGKKDFYFLEMNTRIQVEHPITEIVTGIDLVKEQIRLAAGEKLGYDKDDVRTLGHAIECRINAENPDMDFAPSPGKITGLVLPGGPGVRVDTHIYAGYTVPTNYDSLLGKLIVGSTRGRDAAVSRMSRALREFQVEGIKTTIPFHKRVMANGQFQKGDFATNFIEKHLNANGNDKDNHKPYITKTLLDASEVLKKLAGQTAELEKIADVLVDAYKNGNKMVLFGNGGSAADAQHIATELLGGFTNHDRESLPALALTTDTSALTAIGNDYDFTQVFSRQVESMANPGDVVVAISTSGNSVNVIKGAQMAKKRGATVVGFTGETGGKLKSECDLCLCVPSKETAHIQETHITVGHILCAIVEQQI